MSDQLNSVIELSNEELDLVAGGAISETDGASFLQKENALVSNFSVGPNGVTSGTIALNNTTLAKGAKAISII